MKRTSRRTSFEPKMSLEAISLTCDSSSSQLGYLGSNEAIMLACQSNSSSPVSFYGVAGCSKTCLLMSK